jgi:hypothetical protein
MSSILLAAAADGAAVFHNNGTSSGSLSKKLLARGNQKMAKAFRPCQGFLLKTKSYFAGKVY